MELQLETEDEARVEPAPGRQAERRIAPASDQTWPAEPDKAAPDAARKSGLKRILVPVLALLVLVAAGYAGWQWWTVWRFIESTDDAYVQSDMSVVSPEVAGYVRAVRVEDNQQVAKGDVLLVIDDRDYAARVAAASADLAASRADVETAVRQITLQQAEIAQADAAVASAEADLVQARQDSARYQALSQQDFASRQRLETATASLKRAEAGLAQVKAAATAARDRLPVLQAAQQKAAAGLASAQAAQDVARTNLERTVLRAPVDGVIGNKGVRVGEYVQPGRQVLSVVPLPYVYVVANFKETQLADMRPGQPVELAVDAYPDDVLTGRLESFAPATGAQFSLLPPENATGNFTKIVQRVPVRIAVPADNPLAGRLRPGLSVEASIDTRAAGQGDIGGVFGARQPDLAVARH